MQQLACLAQVVLQAHAQCQPLPGGWLSALDSPTFHIDRRNPELTGGG